MTDRHRGELEMTIGLQLWAVTGRGVLIPGTGHVGCAFSGGVALIADTVHATSSSMGYKGPVKIERKHRNDKRKGLSRSGTAVSRP